MGFGGSGFPGVVVVLVDGVVVGVEAGVAGAAEKDEVVEVGWAFGGGFPRHDVVGLAAGVIGAAEHAALVSEYEGDVLGGVGVAVEPGEPEWGAVAVIEGGEDVGVGGVVG